jgi:hypothetical protein
MAILITRTAVVPVWLLACALVVVWAAPSGRVATGLLLLSSGLAAAAILLLGKNAAHASVSDGPAAIDVRPLSVTAVPRQLRPPVRRPAPSADRLGSWPNSGFRNIGRGTKGG